MGDHLPLHLQTATSGRSYERYFVGIAHNFNSGIRLLYCPINKSNITRHSYEFLDTVIPNAPVYVISDPNFILNASFSDDNLSNNTSFASESSTFSIRELKISAKLKSDTDAPNTSSETSSSTKTSGFFTTLIHYYNHLERLICLPCYVYGVCVVIVYGVCVIVYGGACVIVYGVCVIVYGVCVNIYEVFV